MKNGSIIKKLTFLFGVPVIVIAALIIVVPGQAHDPNVVLTGFGTPEIDGILSPGEWDSAGSIDFPVNTPWGGVTNGTLFIMNDEENLYIAIWFSYTDWRNSASITFDNHDGGALQPGDDYILINPDVGFCDEAGTTELPCPQGEGALCFFHDTDLGGTNDGTGAFSNDEGFTVYEFSHPLDSADDEYDFSLSPGDTVGFNVHIILIAADGVWPDNTGDTSFPAHPSAPWLYGDIVLQRLGRFSDLGDGTVRDNSTGLIWLKDANCFGQMYWYDAMDAAASLADGQCGLTDSSVAGDWRLPTKEEWEAFVDTQYEDPALCNAAGTGQWSEGDAFNNVKSTPTPYDYWSSTPYGGFFFYLMPMLVGEIAWGDWTIGGGVWPVRGGTITPTGPDVVVHPVDARTGMYPVTLTFSEVTQAGMTSLTTGSYGPSPPSGFQLGDPPMYYDMTTTAAYSGLIEVCIDYTGISFVGSEEDLRLYHYESGAWIDVTELPVDTVNKIICATVDSLSAFAIFEPSEVAIEARYLKEDAINALTDYAGESKHIEKAIKEIEKSLDPELWETDSTLTMKGKKVFKKENKAVKQLMKIVKKKNADQDVKDATLEGIGHLITADQALASTAIEMAIEMAKDAGCSAEGNDDPECNKTLKEIAKAEREMDKAQNKYDKDKYDKAIDHYKKAWEHAQKAMKKVPEPDEEPE